MSSLGNFLDRDGLVEASERVVSLKLLELDRGVLVKELINGKVTSTNTDVDLVSINSDGDSLGSELVDAITLSHEHNLELLSIGEVVDVLRKSLVDGISLDGNVNGNTGLEVDDVLLEGLNLKLSVLKVSEELNAGLAGFEILPFKLLDVPGGSF